MITVLTGQPGNGKTSKIIQVIREANEQGRLVYTVGIPKLLLPTIQVTRAQIMKWQERTEITVAEKDAYRITRPFNPLADFNRMATEPALDGEPTYLLDNFVEGSLIVVDEAQKGFQPTSSNKVPEWVSYLSEHRHHAMDFMFISQHPNYLHDNVTGQASRHWHIRNEWMGRKIYEWPEVQSTPASMASRLSGVKKPYKLDPTTYDLYESASGHTVLKHKVPPMAYLALFMVIALPTGAYAVYNRLQQRLHPEPKTAVIPNAPVSTVQKEPPIALVAVPLSAAEPIKTAVYENVQIVSNQYDWSQIAACMASTTKCTCYGDSAETLVVPENVCRSAASSGWSGRAKSNLVVNEPKQAKTTDNNS